MADNSAGWADGSEGRCALDEHTISSRDVAKAVRLLRMPPAAMEATSKPGDGAGAVAVLLPGGLRLKQHTAGPVNMRAEHAATRGVICGFSRRARQRMIERLMAVDWPNVRATFITLTWHEAYGTWDHWKKCLKLFEARLARQYDGRLRGLLWKLEIMRRKSGLNIGQPAPHFHICAFWHGDAPNIEHLRAWVAENWTEVAAPGDAEHRQAGSHCIPARNTSGADMGRLMSYLSKYMGKVEAFIPVDPRTGEIFQTGRVWGCAGDVPCVLIGAYHLGGGAFVQFCARVAEHGAAVQCRYLAAITPNWQGFSVAGDGLLLFDTLMQGLALDAIDVQHGRVVFGHSPACTG